MENEFSQLIITMRISQKVSCLFEKFIGSEGALIIHATSYMYVTISINPSSHLGLDLLLPAPQC